MSETISKIIALTARGTLDNGSVWGTDDLDSVAYDGDVNPLAIARAVQAALTAAGYVIVPSALPDSIREAVVSGSCPDPEAADFNDSGNHYYDPERYWRNLAHILAADQNTEPSDSPTPSQPHHK